MKRNPDGTYRNARHAIVVSARFIVGRWVSAEIMACKRKGLSMAAISTHISRVGQGLEPSLSPFPDGIAFPPDYRISESAIYKRYHKAMDRQPAIDAQVYRKEDTARLVIRSTAAVDSNSDVSAIDICMQVLGSAAARFVFGNCGRAE